MPVEAKPLFRPDVLRSHLAGFLAPPVITTRLQHWAEEIASGRLDRIGEQATAAKLHWPGPIRYNRLD